MDENIQKLRDYGLSDEDIQDLLQGLQDEVSIAVFYDVMESFSDEERDSFEKELSAMDEPTRLDFLADKYFEKSGKKLLTRVLEIVERYISLMANILTKYKELAEKIGDVEIDVLEKKIDKLSKAKDWEGVKKVLDSLGIEEDLKVMF